MKHLFVPYELALLAKKNDFNEDCLAYYETGYMVDDSFPLHIGEIENVNFTKTKVSAPLYQQLVDWFREEYDIMISINRGSEYMNIAEIFTTHRKWSNSYPDYYEALTAALTEAFKLI